jgi:hypothetical protein
MFTGINPYKLADTDVIVFNQTISGLSNGGETKFLSGIFSRDDILPPAVVTEPTTLAILVLGILLLSRLKRDRARLRVA